MQNYIIKEMFVFSKNATVLAIEQLSSSIFDKVS